MHCWIQSEVRHCSFRHVLNLKLLVNIFQPMQFDNHTKPYHTISLIFLYIV